MPSHETAISALKSKPLRTDDIDNEIRRDIQQ